MHSSRFRRSRKITAGTLAFLSVFSLVWPGFINTREVSTAEAAQVTIDPGVSANGTSHIMSGSQTVFISDQTGYKFFRDLAGYCVYRKTTDGGSSWSATTTVDAQTDCVQIQVWYDRWTPGDTGNYIHIATLDTSADDIFYNRLDTGSSDTLLMGTAPVSMVSNSAQAGSIQEGVNFISITKATNGVIYAVTDDSSTGPDSYVVECAASCNLAASWIETDGATPLDTAGDYNILVPLPGDDIMLINRDISLDDIRARVWDDSADTWGGWTTIDGNTPENTTYDIGMAVAVSSSTPGNLYLAYIARNTTLGTDDQVRGARYNGSTWATTTDILTSTTRGLTNVAIGIDAANDDVYVAYTGRTTAGTANTGNVYWKWATSSMQNWSAEVGPINSSADDFYGLDLNIVSDQRIYATWFDNTDDDIYGDTIADIFPGIHASSSGTQTATVYASTTNVYVGGKFVLYNTYKPIDVTGITLTESGTINGSTNIGNVKLLYESDTVAPYDCATNTYDGTESQFGSTDANGFSGADGTSAFTGTSATVSTSSAMCVYVVLDVLNNTVSGATIDISIANPTSDITATGPAGPSTAQNISGTTQVLNDQATQTHFHWRNDNGTESSATSRTANTEDTALAALQQGTSTRLRLQVSNEGGSSTPVMQYRLEYAQNPGQCSDATGWTDVGASGGDFDMHDSPNLTNGNDTTDIALSSLGAVTNPGGKTFLTPNGAIRDTSSQTGDITLSTTQFVEFEYSILASTTATEGNSYCFRLTDRGEPLFAYNQYPRVNIAADISVSATGTQTATINLPATNFYVGGAYVITDNTNTHNVTSITITASGTVDIQNDLNDIRLYYDLDTSVPYDCSSESYGGSEPQYGATSTAFSATSSATFTGSIAVSTTSTMCVYTVLDTSTGAQNGETVEIILTSPSTNVVVSGGGSVSPTVDRNITGITTFQGAVLTQTHYHWRSDNGTEATASSTTNGTEDTAVSNVAQTTPLRLRLQVSNEGSVTSASRAYTLEYGAKVTTCSAVSSWINVSAPGGAFDLYNSTNLTDGNDTTDVNVSLGGVTNPGGKTFLSPNSAVKDTSGYVASTTLTSSQFLETEFSLQQTVDAGYDITYCFRLSTSEVPLNVYSVYPELTTAPERDFEIQRNTATINAGSASVTITAGTNYIAPAASTSAFIRITNSHYTGAGDSAGGATQNADDVTAYIVNPSNIMNSVTFSRLGTTGNTRISWEIIEFIGEPGSDNEMIVRSQTALAYGTTATTATGTAASVTDDADVVVFITGQQNPDTLATDYNTGQSTSEWSAANDQPVFRRGEANGDAVNVSYAVVEFTGQNWAIQRSEHTFTAAGTTQTEEIQPVNSLARTFLHTQRRIGTNLPGVDEFGHEVWLSSIGEVSYFLETGAGTSTGQVSVAWVIENTQTTAGTMDVTRSNNSLGAGTNPVTYSISINKTLSDLTNASIFVNTRAVGTGTNYPRPIVGATIASTTHYELWRSNSATGFTYRTEIVEWPTAGLALQQTHYRFYVDNNALTPTEEWPAEGGGTLGEDTVLTAGDNPLGEGDRIRIRMAIQAQNATLPAGTRAFRLQYGQMTTSCTAITEANWKTLGNSASSTIWRGVNATGTVDGTELTALLLTLSDATGTLEEINDTDVNTYAVQADDEIEYDWIVEQNGATAETYYCFRMVNQDGTPLDRYSSTYPQLRTASFTPRTQNWQWYDDETNVTPSVSLEAENTTPPNIANGQAVKLRVTVKETKNIAREDARFKLQYSEYANFSQAFDVVATSTCTSTSTWCYANGGGTDNAVIPSKILSDADACSGGVGDGCGTHNESPSVLTGFRHEGSAATEYEFTIQSAGPRVNRVYYFRLYDTTDNLPVSTNTGESYPSLATEGASLDFTMTGITSGTVVEGVTTDIATTPTTVNFGALSTGVAIEGAHRLQVDANGTEGYQLFMTMTSDLMTSGGATIKQITGTNVSPTSWDSGCDVNAASCFGYHTGDDTLEGGSTRFSAVDTYARFSTTTAEEVSYSSQPVLGDTTDIVFRILVRDLQDAGIYETNIVYISVPIF